MLAGCSGSSSKTPSTPSASLTASSSSPAASASAAPASLAQLNKIVLQPADLPAAWKGTPYQADPSNAADQAAMVKCLGARNTDPDKVAEANSQDFALGDATISSSATSYRSQSDLDVDTAIARSPKFSACFEQLLSKQLVTSLPAGTKIASESVKFTPGSAGGPANVIATGEGTINVTANGQQTPLYLMIAFIIGPLIEAKVDAGNIGAPLPASLVNSLITTVATRAARG